MKRWITLVLLAVLAAGLLGTASADDNKNQVVQVLEITEGAEEHSIMNMEFLTDGQMMELLAAFRKTEEAKTLLPEKMKFQHLTMLRQRDVYNENEPVDISVRVWGVKERYVLVFFKEAEQEQWTILKADQGEFLDFTLPGDGQYAIAWGWD